MKALLSYTLMTLLVPLLAGCTSTADPAPAHAGGSTIPSVPALVRTQPVAGETESAAIALAATTAGSGSIIATGPGGLGVYGLDGSRHATLATDTANVPADTTSGVAISYGYSLAGKPTTLLATINGSDNSLHLFTLRNGSLSATPADSGPLGFSVQGVCLFQNRLDGILYALVIGEGGEVDQQMVYTNADGELDLRHVRRIDFPSELKRCVAGSNGNVYVSQESTGIWRFNGNPEAALNATIVDVPKLGHITGETGGLALYDGGDGSRWLLAALPSAGRINVYDRDRGDAFIGSFTVTTSPDGATIEEPGTLAATSMALGEAFPHGMLLVGADGETDYRLVSMADVAAALGLSPGTPQDPRHALTPPVPTVTALVETAPVKNAGDAADDPAIWADPDAPARSVVIGTDKQAGMYLYDMQGKVLQFRPDGDMNNTDLRGHFELAGDEVVLVTASDRTHDSIAIYRLDTQARQLVEVADGLQDTGMDDPYGLCMYRNPDNGKTYVFVTTNGKGLVRQWELVAADGRVHTRKVREFRFDSQTEGCAAHDAAGVLFVDEEDKALWTLGAQPESGDNMNAIDRVDDNPALVADLEGVGIYDLGNGRGYIVISVQGNDTYAVYRLEGDHEYLGSFAVVADGARGIDGISQTDGLEVTSRNLGPGFEHGAMIAQDGRNVLPPENQNYKYVSWDAIAAALDLEVRKSQP